MHVGQQGPYTQDLGEGGTPGPCTGIVSVSAAATRVELRLRFGRFICLDWGFVRVKVNSNSNSNCQLASTYED